MSKKQANKQRFAAQQRHKRSNQKAFRLTLVKILSECLAPDGEGPCVSCMVSNSAKVFSMTMGFPVRMVLPVEPRCEWSKESSALPVAQKVEV